MKLEQLLKLTSYTIYKNINLNPEITSLIYDSRNVKAGALFFATDGVHTDGHHYIENAIDTGAVAIVHANELENYHADIAYIKVDSPRQSLSYFACAFYQYPSHTLTTIGVTGTDGKSSTVSLISQLLELLGKKAGYLSTVAFKAGEKIYPNPLRQSTPEAPELQEILAKMRDWGSQYAVIETTSHGLSPKNNRLGGVEFDVALLTNVTQEHLEFHGTVEQYRKDKSELFAKIKSSGFGIINANDPHKQLFIDATKRPVYQYGINNKLATCNIEIIEETPSGSKFNLHFNNEIIQTEIKLPGVFNIENATAAFLTVYYLLREEGISTSKIADKLAELQPIAGRMNSVRHTGGFAAIIDYAHTPGSFEKLLPSMKAQTKGNLIVVFGSAGERDTTKRPIQGKIADDNADIIILTDEDPRLENPLAIINDIAKGCPQAEKSNQLFKIENRQEAIKKAISIAKPEDTILFLGKGHESCIFYADGKRPWNEQAVVEEALLDFGYTIVKK